MLRFGSVCQNPSLTLPVVITHCVFAPLINRDQEIRDFKPRVSGLYSTTPGHLIYSARLTKLRSDWLELSEEKPRPGSRANSVCCLFGNLPEGFYLRLKLTSHGLSNLVTNLLDVSPDLLR